MGRAVVRGVFGLALALGLAACGPRLAAGGAEPGFDPGTRADRAALFDYLVDKTLERDAFASLPHHPYHQAHPAGLDIVEAMGRYRNELLDADTDEKLYYALLKISNARKDRHLRIRPVSGGLAFPDTFGIAESLANMPVAGTNVPRAPILLRADYDDPHGRFLFVADFSRAVAAGAHGPAPTPGDRLVAVNGTPVDEYREAVRPYHRYSTEPSFWWQLATWIPQRSVQFPRRFYGEGLTLRLARRDGSAYELAMPYQDPSAIEWVGHGARRYPGFSRVAGPVSDFETFDLYLPDDDRVPVVLLQWHGFAGDLPAAMDALMVHARTHGLLGHHVVVDATRGGGGSRGAYAVQRLQPRPFRTTFGNLKVSDGMQRWVERQVESLSRDDVVAGETTDGGAWLREWLETDVRLAIESGSRYTNNVPFKLAHAPRHSDGILQPAPVHFTGGLTVWLGPKGGSHMDQFASQVVDNGLAHVMGMPAGGYSNTWEYTETLRFPTTGRPITTYQWSMGHSIRPNGEIIQYNPAQVHEWVPQTRDNYFDYHARLLARTLERLGIAPPPELATPDDGGAR
jgi:hypothetical protein